MTMPGILFLAVLLGDAEPQTKWAEPLSKLLERKDDRGNPVFDDATLAYLKGLPADQRELLGKACTDEVVTTTKQLKALLDLRLPVDKFDLLIKDTCVLCHTDPESHGEKTLFTLDDKAKAHHNLKNLTEDVHFKKGLLCSGCHGGDSTSLEPEHAFVPEWPKGSARKDTRAWIPGFCGRCHSNAVFMQSYNPELPTDQEAKYRTSHHGKDIVAHADSKAPVCINCHGLHDIRSKKDPNSTVYPSHVVETCGSCHANAEYMQGITLEDGTQIPTTQMSEFTTSVHGKALLERGELAAPACNDCHGTHSDTPKDVAKVSQSCRTCHLSNGRMFDGSNHKKAFEEHGFPECSTCHNKHAIQKTGDHMLSGGQERLCYDCHEKNAPEHAKDCIATAEHFHQTLSGMAESEQAMHEALRDIEHHSLDGELVLQSAEQLHDALKQSRSAIHTFDRGRFDETAKAGLTAVAHGKTAILETDKEYFSRLTGVGGAIIATGLLIGFLYLKVKKMER